jgi:hypothetical protein
MSARDSLNAELARRAERGLYPVTMAELDSRLRAIGYRLDRSMDCMSSNRYMTGEFAGESYPACNLYPVQCDDGLSFANVDVRRDASFSQLQDWRMSGALFAVAHGALYEL